MSSVIPDTSRKPVTIEADFDADILSDVRYAIDNGYEYAKTIANHLSRAMHPHPDLSGLTIAEMGTPDRFGPMLVCRAFGAQPTVINTHFVDPSDRFEAFIRALITIGQEEFPDAQWQGLAPLTQNVTTLPDILERRRIDYRTGDLTEIEDASFDAIVTNAVLNQVWPVAQLMTEICRITRPNGFGIHQVDLRDPLNYAQPFEFLALPETQVAQLVEQGTWNRGNRLRVHELIDVFREAGLRVDHFGPNLFASSADIAQIRPRLSPHFADMSDDQLSPVSGRFYLRAITDAQVREDVEYAVRIAFEYLDLIAQHIEVDTTANRPLADLDILELGPGRHFGTPIILSAFGARCAVLDKYLAHWDEVYHPRFYAFLLDALQKRDPSRSWSALKTIIDEQTHPESLIAQDATDLATPPSSYPDASFDVIVSNAVLEHVGDVPLTAREMARLTRPGGINIHQVDFRDHRGFDRPLEFLTIPDDEYRKLFDESMNGNGNRVRAHWMADMFADAGFSVDRFDPNIFAPDEHIKQVRPRLQPQFAALSDEELRVVSGRLFLTRAGAGRIAPETSTAHLTEEQAQRIERDVEYSILNGAYYVSAIANRLKRPLLKGAPVENNGTDPSLHDLTGLRVLELGPGTNFGTTLFCTGCGATVAVFDKYLAKWEPDYHPHVYRKLLHEVRRRFPYADWTHLQTIVESQTHREDIIPSAIGDLAQPPIPYPDDAFDAIVSNAVLEHIGDTDVMARELARITALGGIGIHQVDFRDHQAQSQPLTFLALEESEFRANFDEVNNTQGNRVRPREMGTDFKNAGFAIDEFEANLFADDDHLEQMRPRLQPRFAAMPDEELRVLSGRFFVRIPASAGPTLAQQFDQPRADVAHQARLNAADSAENAAQPADIEFTDTINDQVGYALRNAIDYAYHIGSAFGRHSGPMPDFTKIHRLESMPDLTGLSILELGPGRNFGSILVLMALGATGAILDKYVAKWDSTYHPRFYRSLKQAASNCITSADWSVFDRMLEAKSHAPKIVPQFDADLADPPSTIPPQSFDVILSNAVLEHVGDTFRTACELARLTRPDGLGIHQIDFRDHRDFDKPFEFLTVEETAYRKLFLSTRNENGNRRRCHEWVQDFNDAGFDTLNVEPNLHAKPEALSAVRDRLTDRFATMTDEQLLVLSARVFVRRNQSQPPQSAFANRHASDNWIARVVGRLKPGSDTNA